jgi:hypothetical protein
MISIVKNLMKKYVSLKHDSDEHLVFYYEIKKLLIKKEQKLKRSDEWKLIVI